MATPYQNLGALETGGVEPQVHWGLPFFAEQTGGGLYVDTSITWLYSIPPRAAPEVTALTTFGYRDDSFGGGLRWRYQSSLDDVIQVLTPSNVQPGVPNYQLWDALATWRMRTRFELQCDVNNLLDDDLPIVASSQTLTDVALYDVIGRSHYLGLRANS